MIYIKFVGFFSYLILSCIVLHANNIATQGQGKFFELCENTRKYLNENKKCSQAYLDENVRPLLLESIHKGEIWNNTQKHKEIPVFSMFLTPNIAEYKNPFFTYALSHFLVSDRFQKGDLQLQQETCFNLIKMLKSEDYTTFRPFILRMLFNYFHSPKYYSENSKRWIKEIIVENDLRKTPKTILLLLFLDKKDISYSVVLALKKQVDLCNSINRNDILSWISLILLAKLDQQEYMDKLLQIIGRIDNSAQNIENATYIFPYLTLVQNAKIVEQLTLFLADEKIIDQGDDILQRYKGLSSLAANVLYTMIEAFPTFSRYEFNEQERRKCLDWMTQNKIYKFREIDYWNNDPIIKRMRYMIFEY